MVWYAHLFQNFPQFIVIHTVEDFGIANKAEIDVFLELLCFLGIGMKADLLWPQDTAEISKFDNVLSAALSQHHLLGFEIAQLELHHLH